MAFKLNKDKFKFGEGTGSSPKKIIPALLGIANIAGLAYEGYQAYKKYKKGKEEKDKKKTTQKVTGGGGLAASVVKAAKNLKKTAKLTGYDKAYKNRDMKTYGKMSKAEYIKEAKRQKAVYDKTGKWDVKKNY